MQARTITRLLQNDLESVAQLRQFTVRQLWRVFGKNSLQDVTRALSEAGMALEGNPTQLEMWRHGAIAKADLVHTDDSALVKELMPWLGRLPAQFEKLVSRRWVICGPWQWPVERNCVELAALLGARC